jgi:hypothetical protein
VSSVTSVAKQKFILCGRELTFYFSDSFQKTRLLF